MIKSQIPSLGLYLRIFLFHRTFQIPDFPSWTLHSCPGLLYSYLGYLLTYVAIPINVPSMILRAAVQFLVCLSISLILLPFVMVVSLESRLGHPYQRLGRECKQCGV
ncbi:hypothetical protein BS17DRAFT_871324 [Gyrodon lividus]|nr:hypothetical protein BS17DRAFT_871324 [Gyrodon lividus]